MKNLTTLGLSVCVLIGSAVFPASSARAELYEYRMAGLLDTAGDFELTVQMETDLEPELVTDLGALWTSFSGLRPVVSFHGRINNIDFHVDESYLQSDNSIQILQINDNSNDIGNQDLFSLTAGVDNPGHIQSIAIGLNAPNGESSLHGLHIPGSAEELVLESFHSANFSYTTFHGGIHSGTIHSLEVVAVPAPAGLTAIVLCSASCLRRKRQAYDRRTQYPVIHTN